MFDSKKTFCQAPWTALEINPRGNVSTDSQCTKVLGNLKNQTLKEILKGRPLDDLRTLWKRGEFPDDCSNCFKKETAVGHSRRIFFDHKLGAKTLDELERLEPQPSIDYLELNLSNLCNLKCRMCNSVSSSSWVKDEEQMQKMGGLDFALPKESGLKNLDLEIFQQLIVEPSFFKNLKMLALRGGEPLLNPYVPRLLETLVDWGIAPQITLDISTNGTKFNPKILNLLKQFKGVDLYISIEGAGPLYQYIRGGFDYSILDLEAELGPIRELANTTVIFAVTVSVYNVLYLSELIDWFAATADSRDEFMMSNVVVRPEFLNFQILPKALKELAHQKLSQNTFLLQRSKRPERRFPDSGYHLVLNALSKEIYSLEAKERLMTQFIKYNEAVDRIRGENLESVAPELYSLIRGGSTTCSRSKETLS